MSIKDKIAEAKKRGEVYVLSDPADIVNQLPNGRSVIEIFSTGPYEEINTKTSRLIGPGRGQPAELLLPLKYVFRGGPKGGVTMKGTLKPGTGIFILGWPGFTDKDHCDLIVLHGDHEFSPSDQIDNRAVRCKEGVYVNLEEGVDYKYTGIAPISATKTSNDIITMRDIDYVDDFGCEGVLPAMTSARLCDQFDETFIEFEGTRILLNPIEGEDYM